MATADRGAEGGSERLGSRSPDTLDLFPHILGETGTDKHPRAVVELQLDALVALDGVRAPGDARLDAPAIVFGQGVVSTEFNARDRTPGKMNPLWLKGRIANRNAFAVDLGDQPHAEEEQAKPGNEESDHQALSEPIDPAAFEEEVEGKKEDLEQDKALYEPEELRVAGVLDFDEGRGGRCIRQAFHVANLEG